MLFFSKQELLYGKTVNQTARLDSGTCTHVEESRSEKDASCTNRQGSKANRGSYSSKGIQHGNIARFSRIIHPEVFLSKEGPACGAFYLANWLIGAFD
jgi:hypothetical protein